jgi:hypothetical protein
LWRLAASMSTGPRFGGATRTVPPVAKSWPRSSRVPGLRRRPRRGPTRGFRSPQRPGAPEPGSGSFEKSWMTPARAALPQAEAPPPGTISAPAQGVHGHEAPRHPAPEGVVQGNSVEEDERAAGAARPEAAQGDALRGRVRRHAVVAPEEAEVGLPASASSTVRERAVVEGLGRDDLDREGNLRERLRGAGGAHRHRVEVWTWPKASGRIGQGWNAGGAHRGVPNCPRRNKPVMRNVRSGTARAGSHLERPHSPDPTPHGVCHPFDRGGEIRRDRGRLRARPGGQAAYTLTMDGARVLMIEAGRNYDPRTETPMFQTPDRRPCAATPRPTSPSASYDATVDGGWSVPGEPYTNASAEKGRQFMWWRARMLGGRTNHWGATRCATAPTTSSPAAATASASTGRSPTRTWRPITTRSRC